MIGARHEPGIQILTCQAVHLAQKWVRHRFSAPYWRLYWNRRPGAAVVWRHRRVPLLPNRVLLIPPETDYVADLVGTPAHLYIHFLAASPYDVILPDLFAIDDDPILLAMAAALLPEAGDGCLDRRQTLLSLALVHAALSHLPDRAITSVVEDSRVTGAIALMGYQMSEPLTNRQLAEQVGMSTNGFVRLFRKLVGMSPQTYYRRRRIDRSCVLLHFTEMKIEQIARKTGFCDRYHFSRAFRQMRGISPAIFRRQRGMAHRDQLPGVCTATPFEND